MSKPKYKQGKQIRSVSEFSNCKCLWYKWNGKTVHRAFLVSLQYRVLESVIECGRLYATEFIEPVERKENRNE